MNKTTTRSPRRWLIGSLMVACLVMITGSTTGCLLGSRLPGGAARIAAGNSTFPTTPVIPPPGYIFTAYRAPLDFDFTDEGKGTPVGNLKEGESFTQFLGLPGGYRFISVGWGDASLDAAKENGGITELTYADYETLSILGIYTQFRIRAYGN